MEGRKSRLDKERFDKLSFNVNTRARVDMEFLFEGWTRYLTSGCGNRVCYGVEHEKINSTCNFTHVQLRLFSGLGILVKHRSL